MIRQPHIQVPAHPVIHLKFSIEPVSIGAGGEQTGMQPSRNIMLVEDDAFDRQVLERAIREIGATVKIDWQQESWKALEKLNATSQVSLPEMIFLDLRMPRVDGFQVLRELKENARLAEIPVIVISTSSEMDDRKKAINLGARDYVVKTFDFNEFVTQLKRILEL